MSSGKRNQVLIVVAVLAVVLGGVYWFNSSSVRREDATGAIGAVKKHREPQIAATDVVLTDEKTHKTAKVLFVDYLADAAQLQNVSADLGLAVLEQKAVESKNLAQKSADALESHSAELQNRYYESMSEALTNIRQLAEKNVQSRQLENIRAEIAEVEAAIRNKEALESARMEQLNSRLGRMIEQLQAALGSQGLKQMEKELASALAPLQGKKLQNADVLSAAAQLESAAQELNAQSPLGGALNNHHDYLASIAIESHVLENAQKELNAMMQSMEQVENKASLDSQLRNLSAELASQAAALESKALNNMEASLQSQSELASALKNIESMLDNASKSLGTASDLENRSLESFHSSLASFRQELNNRNAELMNRAAANMQAELGAVSVLLSNHEQLNNRLQNAQSLENAQTVENKQQLEQISSLANRLANKDILASFQAHLGHLSEVLASQSMLASNLRNQEQLANQAKELSNKASLLQSFEH